MSQTRIKQTPEFHLSPENRRRIAELQVELVGNREQRIAEFNDANLKDARRLDDLIEIIAKEMAVDVKTHQLHLRQYKFIQREK